MEHQDSLQQPASIVAKRHVPRGYNLLARYGTAEVFGQTTEAGKVFAIAYGGKRTKPDWHYGFGTSTERRTAKITQWLSSLQAREQRKQEQKAKQNAPHSLKVGDVLHTRWGYDQTNVEFFEVTRVVGAHTVELREIAAHYVETGFMSGRTRPKLGRYIAEPIRRRARGNNSVRIDDVRDAWPTEGRREYYTSSYA